MHTCRVVWIVIHGGNVHKLICGPYKPIIWHKQPFVLSSRVHFSETHLCISTYMYIVSTYPTVFFIMCTHIYTQEYKLSQDLNRLDTKRTYLGKLHNFRPLLPLHTSALLSLSLSLFYTLIHTAHSNRVTALKSIADEDWLLSVSRDKYFQWHCTKSGRKLGSFEAHAWCLAVEYPFYHINVYMCSYKLM